MIDTALIFGPFAPTLVELYVEVGHGVVHDLRNAAIARGVQFRDVRLSMIQPGDVRDMPYLDSNHEIVMAAFDPVEELKIDRTMSALVVLMDASDAAPAVLEKYSSIASEAITVVVIRYR